MTGLIFPAMLSFPEHRPSPVATKPRTVCQLLDQAYRKDWTYTDVLHFSHIWHIRAPKPTTYRNWMIACDVDLYKDLFA